jgi:hypothetical protein
MTAQYAPAQIVAVEAGIDWLTWVVREEKRDGVALQIGQRLVAEQEAKGSKVSAFSAEGYQGYQAEQCAYGWRKDTDYLRLSGNLAFLNWSAVSSASGHPTRIDVQCTLLLNRSDKRFGSQLLRQRSAKESHPPGRSPKRTCLQDSKGAWLGTVGTRTSEHYLRVYDKGIEAGSHPQGTLWRIEVEAKQAHARELWKELLAADDRNEWYLSCVRRACRRSRCTWPPAINAELLTPPVKEITVLPSVERCVAWLASSVRPCIQRILTVVDVEDILVALGLDGYASADVVKPRVRRRNTCGDQLLS